MATASRAGALFIRTDKANLFSDTLLVASLTAAAKAAGAVKTVVLAGIVGPGLLLDAYLLAFLIPSFLGDVFCTAILPTLVPRIAGLRQQPGREGWNVLYAEVFGRILCFAAAGSALLAIGALIAGHVPLGEKARMTCESLLWMAPMLVFTACSNVWRAVLVATHQFVTVTIAPCLSPIIVIGFLVCHNRLDNGLRLAAGTLLGSAAEALLLAITMQRKGWRAFPRRTTRLIPNDPLWAQYGFLLAGNLAASGAALIDQCMAAFSGPGGFSVYNFGTKIPNMLLSTGPAALGTTTLPRLAETAAENGRQAIRILLARVLCVAGIAGTAISLMLMSCSSSLVRITMQHGAFTAADTWIVSRIQSYSLLQLPFAMCTAVLSRAIAASGANHVMAPVAACTTILTIVLDYVLCNRMGAAGIALSRTVILAITAAALGVFVFSRVQPGARAAESIQ